MHTCLTSFRLLAAGLALTLGSIGLQASEADALAISANIQAKHLPFGTIVDPIYSAPTSDQIVGYTRCGDSAIWTGAYLAAEAFRYKVTQSPAALTNVKAAVAGIKALTDVTAINLLARCMVLKSSPFAAGISMEEAPNGVHTADPWIWVGNTSRDQYTGVIFGLAIAYDMVDDATVKTSISDLVTRLVRYLTGNNWTVKMPDGSSSTTFLPRPDEILTLIQVGRHVNPNQFSTYYTEQRILLGDTGAVLAPPGVDAIDNSSYFKFNLAYMSFYNLVRLESSFTKAIYEKAYEIERNHTASHQNAFFDIVDRALRGPDAGRDAEARALLDQWLQRSRRDQYVDQRAVVPVCGLQACQPVPVPLRPPTDFLWQRDPFQLTGGGSGVIESSGVDYILPYWMARYYDLLSGFDVQPSAGRGPAVAPESLASIFGSQLATQTDKATSTQLPQTLGGVTVTLKDSAGTQFTAPLVYVSPTQINLEVPRSVAAGTATFTVASGTASQTATAQIRLVAPSLFSMNGNGTGVAAATAIRTQVTHPELQSPVPVFQCGTAGCSSVPIDAGLDTPVYLALYGTGIRNRTSLTNVAVTIHGISVPVLYAGPQPDFPGFDQVNVALTLNLRGSGESDVIVNVDGQASNTVTINIR